MHPSAHEPLSADVLPRGVRSRFVDNGNGLVMHLLEAGFESPERPCVLLLHGFPELAYSWRKVMPALAAAGYHVVAPDQRGYGRTTGGDATYDGDWRSFRLLNLVRDAMGLLAALGRRDVHAVVGHDFGSWVAAWCALVRPDVFPRVVLMSAPFGGAPPLPMGARARRQRPTSTPRSPRCRARASTTSATTPRARPTTTCGTARRACTTSCAPTTTTRAPTGAATSRGRLAAWSAEELAHMPTYYVMDLHKTMAQTVAHEMPGAEAIAACRWLPEPELRVYSREYERTGFQGGLQWYRCAAEAQCTRELQLFAGRTIDVPSMFVAGRSDWGMHQRPGSFEAMQASACTRMRGAHLIDGAGHWVQQEQPEAVSRLLLEFMS